MLLALCGMLTLVLAYEVAVPVALPGVRGAPGIFRPAVVTFADTVSSPTSEAYDDVEARPLFSPTRQAIADAPATATGASGTSDLSLIGVIIEGDERIALVKSPLMPFASSVREGDMIEGMSVATIAADRIVLSSGATRQVILLEANRASSSSGNGSRVAAPPAPPPPVSAPVNSGETNDSNQTAPETGQPR
jgi:hypothetical protein